MSSKGLDVLYRGAYKKFRLKFTLEFSGKMTDRDNLHIYAERSNATRSGRTILVAYVADGTIQLYQAKERLHNNTKAFNPLQKFNTEIILDENKLSVLVNNAEEATGILKEAPKTGSIQFSINSNSEGFTATVTDVKISVAQN
jgi:hypothetical protein